MCQTLTQSRELKLTLTNCEIKSSFNYCTQLTYPEFQFETETEADSLTSVQPGRATI